MKPITSSDWIPFSVKKPAEGQLILTFNSGDIGLLHWDPAYRLLSTHWMPASYLPSPEPPKPAEDPEFVKWWGDAECLLNCTIREIGGRNISRKDARAIWDSIKASATARPTITIDGWKSVDALLDRNTFGKDPLRVTFQCGWLEAIKWVNEGMP